MTDQARTEELRILFVLGRHGRGGTELQAYSLIRALRGAGAHVDVIALEGTPDSRAVNGTVSFQLRRTVSIRNFAAWLRALTFVARRLNSGDYAVAHLAMARAYASVPFVRVRRDVAVVAWRRNMGVHLRSRPIVGLLERAAARRTDILVCNSEAVVQYWKTRLGLPRHRFAVVPNGVYDSFTPVRVVRAPADTLHIVAVGTLKRVKRHDLLLTAVSSLGIRCVVTIYGEGTLRAALEAHAKELPETVELLLPGHLPNPLLNLSHPTIFVQSSDSEGLSNAVLEAVSARIPVVSTATGSAEQIFKNTIAFVPPGDSSALAGAIEQTWADWKRALCMADAAHAILDETFSPGQVVAGHLQVYRRAISERKIARRDAVGD